MPVIEELIRIEEDGTISFGNYQLGAKAKKSDFEYQGDLYKVKTFREITKLERNDMFVYESVPGTGTYHDGAERPGEIGTGSADHPSLRPRPRIADQILPDSMGSPGGRQMPL